MSESETETEAEFDSKSQFLEAVRDDGAELNGTEYFTEGSGSATSYKTRDDEGEVSDITKSDVEQAWAEAHDDGDEAGEEEDEGPEEVHLGTFYFSQSNWDQDDDRETLEDLLDEAGWYIDGEVDSGGYRIKTER